MRLSPHFTLDEATASQTATRKGWSNEPDLDTMENMRIAAAGMEKVRDLFDRAIFVSSWYRSTRLNRAIGGSKTSGHPLGWCIDFKVSGLTVAETFARIKQSGIRYDQLINEFGRWVHISFDPRFRQQSFRIG